MNPKGTKMVLRIDWLIWGHFKNNIFSYEGSMNILANYVLWVHNETWLNVEAADFLGSVINNFLLYES